MVTNTDPYCVIHSYNFSSIVYLEGVDVSGGEAVVEEITSPDWNYADIRPNGRQAKKYVVHARSTDREEIEAFLYEVNNAPEDAFFYPFEATRSGRIASAYATLKPIRYGQGHNYYEADAFITCREAWLYGPDQGCAFRWMAPIDYVSDLITNNGQMDAPINYLQCGGDRVATYVEDLCVRITPGTSSAEHDRELLLCEKLLQGDILELGWRGELWHSYQARLNTLAELTQDLHSKTSGGSITSGVLTLDNSDYAMIPFYGPCPVSGEAKAAYVELTVDALTGDGATVWKALETDLSDIDEVDHDDLEVGANTVYIPDLEGEEHVAIGVKAAAAGSVAISALKGMIKRYVAPSDVPYIKLGESAKLRVEATAGQQLRFLQACIPDRYWY